MKFFVVILVLIGAGAGTAQEAGAGGSASADLGGCSIGAEGNADAGGSSADGSANGGCGQKYVINANRVSQTVPSAYPVLYMYYQIQERQNITFFKTIDKQNPFVIEYYLLNEESGNDVSGENIKTCGNSPEIIQGWDALVMAIIEKGILPNQKCPVAKGNYLIDNTTGPITVYFSEKIECGKYSVTINLDRGSEWALQADFTFTIDDDGTCLN